MPWRMGIRVVELLSSPTFHRAVRRIHGRLTGTQHHEDPPSNLDTGHSGTELEGWQFLSLSLTLKRRTARKWKPYYAMGT
ncbi:Similar to hypothetical protein [Tuber melanosporum Mel28]; acc. no. XP_002839517 [Pyronema omphalodes CBS 100304]|uniref:Uncharacterized protein n=1 Tax=Pyronema omphalodes (strain CBS 100304) TaxID=1076935 RepID=U4LM78_PYROM|nr:Similar to hypothetical protein [Tuber melanosporum Mel28]; acc. no. XP_002839517 [Pyronema omphalodes CBS 100304]